MGIQNSIFQYIHNTNTKSINEDDDHYKDNDYTDDDNDKDYDGDHNDDDDDDDDNDDDYSDDDSVSDDPDDGSKQFWPCQTSIPVDQMMEAPEQTESPLWGAQNTVRSLWGGQKQKQGAKNRGASKWWPKNQSH